MKLVLIPSVRNEVIACNARSLSLRHAAKLDPRSYLFQLSP